MTLRRYTPLQARPGHADPVTPELRLAVLSRDGGCVAVRLGRSAAECRGRLELDHVRASGALGKRSRSTEDNLVTLCSTHHRWKTEHGREARPLLLDYLESVR